MDVLTIYILFSNSFAKAFVIRVLRMAMQWEIRTRISLGFKPCLLFTLLAFVMLLLSTECLYAQAVDSTYTSSGDFKVPAGVTSLKIEAWGSGGNGATGGNNKGGGGGGGGAYVSHPNYPTSENTVYTIDIGSNGSSTTINTDLFEAGGGSDGSGTSGGSGGTTVIFPATPPGGSSAQGSDGDPNDRKDGGAGGDAAGGGGTGGAGGTDGKGGSAAGGGNSPGGGGGGGAKGDVGGGGADGHVIISWTCDLGNVTTNGSTDICSNTAPTGISTSGAEGSSSFTYQWYLQAGFVTPTSGSISGWTAISGQTGTSLTASAITANTTYACWVVPGGVFQCSAANWAGATNTDNVQITVNSGIPTVTGTTPGSSCGTGTVVLGATASSGTIDWYTASTGGTFLGSGTSFTTPSISTTTIFYAEANNGCATSTSRTEVTATIKTIPTITGTTPGSNCGPGTVVLGATASAGTINWCADPTGGSSLGTGTSFTTPSISTTTPYYVDATNNGCTTTSRTAVIATIDGLPTKDTTFTATGIFNVPSGVTNISVEAWGGGGGGGVGSDKNGKKAGGGGGGGAYAAGTVSGLTSGDSYDIIVGLGGSGNTNTGGIGGDSYFDDGTVLIAKGGIGGTDLLGGAGGSGGTSIGNIATWSGGTGGAPVEKAGGGGGGGSAFASANGNDGNPGDASGAGGTGGSGTGAGGAGGDEGADGNPGFTPGGGGGGKGNNGTDTGAGGAGQVKITWTRAFIPPDVPTVTASTNPACVGDNVTLTITGNLNDATQWAIYTGSCGGTLIGTTSTSSFDLGSVTTTTTYYVRGEHECATPGSCGSVTVTVNELNLVVSDISTQPSGNHCPEFWPPFDGNSGSYNPGSSEVKFKVVKELSTSTPLTFEFAIDETGNVEVYDLISVVGNNSTINYTGDNDGGTINAADNTEIEFTFRIVNKPTEELDVKFEVTNGNDGTCDETGGTGDNSLTHKINVMPDVGDFN